MFFKTTKEWQLLGQNYKYFMISATLRRDVSKQTHSLKWVIQLQMNFWQSTKPIEAFYTHKGLLMQIYKAFNNGMT